MSSELLIIEHWFLKHRDDADFVRLGRDAPYSVIGPFDKGICVIFTTKPACVLRESASWESSKDLALIGRHGLPNQQDIEWMNSLVGDCTLVFLGDLDPVDLMVYAWLKIAMPVRSIRYLGLGDAIFTSAGIDAQQLDLIDQSASEKQGLAIVKSALNGLQDVVGMEALTVLTSGQKIELESLFKDGRLAWRALRSLLSNA